MIQPPGPDIPRTDYGQPLVVPSGGGPRVAYQRWTNFVDALENKAGVHGWKLRHALHNISKRPDLALAAAAADPDGKPRGRGGKRPLDVIADKLLEPTSANATIGTTLHDYTAKLDCGQELGPIPDP